MSRLTKIAALALLAPLFLAGCTLSSPSASQGSDPVTPQTSDPAEPDVAPATGTLITGDGYSVNAPEGWVEFTLENGVGTTFRKEGHADNFNVFLSSAEGMSIEQGEVTTQEDFSAAGATEVKVRDRIKTDGAEFAHVSAVYGKDAPEFHLEKLFASNGDATYIITFGFTIDVPEAERLAVINSVVQTWVWS